MPTNGGISAGAERIGRSSEARKLKSLLDTNPFFGADCPDHVQAAVSLHLAGGTGDPAIRGKVGISLCCRRSWYGARAVPLGAKAGGDDEGDAGQRPGSGHLAEQREPGD